MQRGKQRRKKPSIVTKVEQGTTLKKALVGLALAWIVTLVGVLIGSGMIYWEWFEPSWINGIARVIMVISMIVGGCYVFRNTAGRGRLLVLAVLIAYLFIRFLLSLILTF